MGQIAQFGLRTVPTRLLAGATAAVTAAGVAAVFVVAGGPPAAQATTTVQHPHAAMIVLPDGQATAARDGAVLPPGAMLRTATSGSAVLVTAGRLEHVVGGSSVLVRDGERQQLRAGALVVDVRSGPAVDLVVSGTTVRADPGDVLRVEHGFTVRVGTLAGEAQVRTAAGRTATVPALHQVRVNADALPDDAPAPLALVDDAAERATNLPVVVDDVLLRRWAQGVAADPQAQPRLTAAVAAVSLTTSTQCVPAPGAAVSERVLPLAIARSSHARMSLGDRYGRALCDRAEGGSWGVVAHLMQTTAVRTLAQVDALQSDRLLAQGSQSGDSQSVVAAPAPSTGLTGAGDTGATGDSAGAPPATSRPPTAPARPAPSAPAPGPSGPTGPAPGPTGPLPSPVPVPTPPDPGVIGDLVGAVAGLLPAAPAPATTGSSSSGSTGSGLLGAPATDGGALLTVRLPLLTVAL